MKSSYHPAVNVAFYLNCLPSDLLKRIPRSTKHDWRHKDLTTQFGHDWFCSNQHLFATLQQVAGNQKLLRINRALIRIIAIRGFIIKHAACIKRGLFEIPRIITINIAKVSAVLGLVRSLKFLQLPYAAYLKLKNSARCMASALNLCRIKHPAQLLSKEIAVIKSYCSDERFLHWPMSSIYCQIRREAAAFLNLSTFYKYTSLLKLSRRLPAHRRKHHHTGIRAKEPLQILHADVTLYTTADNIKSYIYLVQDNYSRALLTHAVKLYCKAEAVFENLSFVHNNYLKSAAIEDCRLITDDGSENHGLVKDFITNSQHPAIQHLIAQKDIEFSNSMIEAANKQIKYRFLYHQHIADHNALITYVQKAIEDFNNRPNFVLHGLTPLEVLQGQLPESSAYAGQIQHARATRLVENKKMKCCYSF